MFFNNFGVKVIRLSAATQELERSVICNVHGVNPRFLEIGKQKLKEREIGGEKAAFLKGAYYIGKMVWGKGYTELLQLLGEHQTELTGLKMELYGNGEDSDEVKDAAAKLKLDVTVLPGRDHADPIFHEYAKLSFTPLFYIIFPISDLLVKTTF